MRRKIDPKTASILLIVTGALLLLQGILRIVIVIVMVMMPANDDIGIIGGADAPTALYLFSQLGWRGILRIVLPIAFGILCIIVNVIALIKGGRHD